MTWPDDYLIPGFDPYHVEESGIIYCGDCRKILPYLPKMDLMLIDPPYGTGLYKSDKKINIDFLFNMSFILILFGWPERLIAQCLLWKVCPDEWITWWPVNGRLRGMNGPNGLWREQEAVAIFGKLPWGKLCEHNPSKDAIRLSMASHKYNCNRFLNRRIGEEKRRSGDVWTDASPGLIGNAHFRNHPNEKPLTLIKRLLLVSKEEFIICDPFFGSGTTAIAAKELGRRYIGIEIEEKYCAIAVKRLKQCNPLPFHQDLKKKPENLQMFTGGA